MSMRGVKKPGHAHHHLGGAGPVPRRPQDPGRGHAVRPWPLRSSCRPRLPRRSRANRAPLTYGHATSGHGCAQRHTGLVLRRWSLSRLRNGPWPTASTWPARAPMWWTSGASRADPGPSRCPSARSWRRVVPVVRGPGSACPGVGRHRQAGRGRGGGRRPGRHSSTTSRRRCGRWRRSPGWDGWPCTCRARRAPCSTTPATATSSPRCTAFCATGPAERSRPGWTRSGWTPVSASARRPAHNLALLAPPPRARGRGAARARGDESQELPGPLGGGAVGGEPAAVTDRLPGSIATATWAMLAGASMVRVHDVASTVRGGHAGGDHAPGCGIGPSRGAEP